MQSILTKRTTNTDAKLFLQSSDALRKREVKISAFKKVNRDSLLKMLYKQGP